MPWNAHMLVFSEKTAARKTVLPKFALLAALAGLLLILGLVLLLSPQAPRRSSGVEWNSPPEELTAPLNGTVLFIAEAGRQLREGGLLLSLDTQKEASALEETERQFEEKAAALPRPYKELLPAYLFYRLEQDAEKTLPAALEEEKEALAELQAESLRQASLALRLRRLELKPGKTAQELHELETLRAEEALAGEKLAASRERHEKAALARAGQEKTLARLHEIDLALRLAPPGIQTSFAQLHALRLQAQNLEERILKSEIRASRPLRVICTLLKTGEEATAGNPVLRAIPGEEGEISLTAYFTADIAKKLRLGSGCRVEFGQISLPGVLLERRPYVDMGPNTLIPFSVGVPLTPEGKELAGMDIDPGKDISVYLD
jgi:multidrug resistance efflux pump